jgi:hypothetical protein
VSSTIPYDDEFRSRRYWRSRDVDTRRENLSLPPRFARHSRSPVEGTALTEWLESAPIARRDPLVDTPRIVWISGSTNLARGDVLAASLRVLVTLETFGGFWIAGADLEQMFFDTMKGSLLDPPWPHAYLSRYLHTEWDVLGISEMVHTKGGTAAYAMRRITSMLQARLNEGCLTLITSAFAPDHPAVAEWGTPLAEMIASDAEVIRL